MATIDSCSNCARGLTFPLSPIQNKKKGLHWDQKQSTRKWNVLLSAENVDMPPCFHIYFTLGLLIILFSVVYPHILQFLGMIGFICFWTFLLLRIYLPETYWSWSYTSHIRQWVYGAWRNWKLHGRFEASLNTTESIFSKFKFKKHN